MGLGPIFKHRHWPALDSAADATCVHSLNIQCTRKPSSFIQFIDNVNFIEMAYEEGKSMWKKIWDTSIVVSPRIIITSF